VSADPLLAPGCHLLTYTPIADAPVGYDGTLRVHADADGWSASGDLYQRAVQLRADARAGRSTIVLADPPDPAAGIPVFARADFRFYLRAAHFVEDAASGRVMLTLERFRLGDDWIADGELHAVLRRPALLPPEFDPSPSLPPTLTLTGPVVDGTGRPCGTLTLTRVSPFLRKAALEIDRVAGCERPLDNGAGFDWAAVGRTIGWEIEVALSDSDVAQPGEYWTDGQCHAAMLARRDRADLDAQWRYHMLIVPRLDRPEPGVMYDQTADANHVPREGCALQSHLQLGREDRWGLVKGQRLGAATPVFFRSAVHEVGHLMGLSHNVVGQQFMTPTETIAGAASAAQPFPLNIDWSFAPRHVHCLRHAPDPIVRPGGKPLGVASEAPQGLVLSSRHRLDLEMQTSCVPIGVAARLALRLSVLGDAPVDAPAALDAGAASLQVRVIAPCGAVRTVVPPLIDGPPGETTLQPGESVQGTLVLLRDADGTLFASPGVYTIQVRVDWGMSAIACVATAQTHLMVTAAADDAQAQAALTLLTTTRPRPDPQEQP